MDENQKDSIDTLKFEDLNTSKQLEQLSGVYEQLSRKLYDEYRDDFVWGEKEIVDLTFNRNKDGNIVYTIIMQNKQGKLTTMHFSKDLERIDPPIDIMKLMNYDVSEMEAQRAELLTLDENPDRISLSEIKNVKLEKEITQTCNDLGISKEELSYAAVIDSDNQIKLDPNEIKGIKSDMIDGSQKVSTYYRMNDVTGMDYAKYQIIKTRSGSPIVLGITKDGLAEKIDESRFQLLNDVNTMSLMQQNGTTKEASVVAAFRIKSPSDVDRDQVIGLCNDNTSQMTAFYARGAITADKMIGENIPARIYSEHRVLQEKIMDTRTNKDITGEADSMNIRTDDGDVVRTSTIDEKNDVNELIETYSTVYGIKPEILEQEVKEDLDDPSNTNKSDEDIVRENVEEIIKEKIPDTNEPEQEEAEDDALEHVHGTPWGNPNSQM